jgi:hypothetical protein
MYRLHVRYTLLKADLLSSFPNSNERSNFEDARTRIICVLSQDELVVTSRGTSKSCFICTPPTRLLRRFKNTINYVYPQFLKKDVSVLELKINGRC